MAKASGRLLERVSQSVGHQAALQWWALWENAHRAATQDEEARPSCRGRT